MPQIEALNIDNKLLAPLHIPREKILTFMPTEQVNEADIGLKCGGRSITYVIGANEPKRAST